jgi:hypothetical protein
MKQPSTRGAPATIGRFEQWLSEFSGYTVQVTRRKIELWLEQFTSDDQDVAARLLDAVQFFGNEHIRAQLKAGLASLNGWDLDPVKRKGRWVFTAFSGSPGESGDSMVHQFRLANGLSLRKYNNLFVHRSELVSLKLGPDDTVVLIDDFSGTGRQAVDAWPTYEELLSQQPTIYLLLVAATTAAIDVVTTNTDLQISAGTVLGKEANFFSAACKHFNADEKQAVERYCRKVDRHRPKGSGDAGLLVVFAHRCPNNTLPILHTSAANWHALFPRHFN